VDEGGRSGRALYEFEFAVGDILALRTAVTDLEASELCVSERSCGHNTHAHSGWAVAAETSRENATSKMLCELHRLLPLSSLAFSPTYRASTRLDKGAAHLVAENQSSYI
jgi:hypothetical protein